MGVPGGKGRDLAIGRNGVGIRVGWTTRCDGEPSEE